MRNKTFLFLILSALIIFQAFLSCTKKSSDEPNNIQENPPLVTIVPLMGTDTIITKDYFTLIVDNDPISYCRFEILMNGVQKYSKSEKNSYYFVDVKSLSINPGIYQCVFDVYYTPKSMNSGTEYKWTKNIILIYLPEIVSFTPGIVFSNIDGQLSGDLELPPSLQSVGKIMIEKSVGLSNPFFPLKTIIGSPPYAFVDSTYVGELADYRITTYTALDGKSYFVENGTGIAKKNREPKQVSLSVDDNGFPFVQWEKNAYFKNCIGYRIFNKYSKVLKEITTINNPDQTSWTLRDIAFPGENEISVSYIPSGVPPYYNEELQVTEYGATDTIKAGIPSSIQYDYFFSPAGTDFYTVLDNQITGYSVTNQQVTHTIPQPVELYETGVSPNNQYLLAYVYQNGYKYIFYHVPTKTLTYITADKVDQSVCTVEGLSISDNGIGVVGTNCRVVVYDFVNQIRIKELYSSSYPLPVISPDGTHFFLHDDHLYFYSILDGTVTLMWQSGSFEGYYIYYSFFPSDPGKAVIIQDQVCTVRNSADWSLVRTFTVNYDAFANTDYNTGRIFGYSGDLYDQVYRLVDINNGNVEFQFNSNTFLNPYIRFNGKTVFYGKGKKLVTF